MIRAIKHNTHPGEILLCDIIEPNGLTITETAEMLGVTRSNLSNIVNEKSAISPLMAIRISKVFGGTPTIWVRLQAAYDLREAERDFENRNIHLSRFQHT